MMSYEYELFTCPFLLLNGFVIFLLIEKKPLAWCEQTVTYDHAKKFGSIVKDRALKIASMLIMFLFAENTVRRNEFEERTREVLSRVADRAAFTNVCRPPELSGTGTRLDEAAGNVRIERSGIR